MNKRQKKKQEKNKEMLKALNQFRMITELNDSCHVHGIDVEKPVRLVSNAMYGKAIKIEYTVDSKITKGECAGYVPKSVLRKLTKEELKQVKNKEGVFSDVLGRIQ